MTDWRRRASAVLTVMLSVAIVALAGLLIRRELLKDDQDGVHPSEFVADWEELLRIVPTTDTAAKVSIIEFVDLQCPYCRENHRVVRRVARRFGNRVAHVIVHYPLANHPYAMQAAQAAECARDRGMMVEFIETIFAKQDSLGIKPWGALGVEAGISDSTAFAACANSMRPPPALTNGIGMGRTFRVAGTPTTIINGWRFDGALQEQVLRTLVEDLLANRRVFAAPEAGVSPTPSTVRGESGVTRVSYGRDAWTQADSLFLRPIPLAEIGGRDGDPDREFGELTSVALLADGRVVTFDADGSRLRVFSSDGRQVVQVGRQGHGPGEFRKGSLAGFAVDSLVVVDMANRRINWFGSDFTTPMSVTITGNGLGDAQGLIGVLPGRRVVMTSAGMRPGSHLLRLAAGDTATSRANVVLIGGAERIDRVVQVPDLHMVGLAMDMRMASGTRERTVEPTPLRFTPRAHVAVLDTFVVTASSDKPELDVRSPDGVTLWQLAVPFVRRAVTAEMRAAALKSDLDRLAAPSPESHLIDRAGLDRAFRATPSVDSLPYFSAMISSAGPDPTLWVVDERAPGETRWSAVAFDRRGRLRGRLHARVGGTPVAFGHDRVVVRSEDADGIVSLRVYLIERVQ